MDVRGRTQHRAVRVHVSRAPRQLERRRVYRARLEDGVLEGDQWGEERRRRVWAIYGRGVQELFGAVGVEGHVSERRRSGEEAEEGGEEDCERDHVEEGVEETKVVILSGDVDPQPHLAPLPLPR